MTASQPLSVTVSPAPAPLRPSRGRPWLLASPALVLIILASIGPLLAVLIYSVLSPGNFGGVSWTLSSEAWFQVFRERDIFDDTVSWNWDHLNVLGRSLGLAALTTVLTLLLGFPIAWFIVTRDARNRSLWLFLITLPFWTNLLVRIFAIQELLRDQGVINSLLLALGLVDQPLKMLLTPFAIGVGMTYVYLPLMVLPVYASLERLDLRLVEAAYDLYATPGRVLRRVVLPLARPGIAAGCTLVFIPAIGAYVIPRILGGGLQMLWGNLIEFQFGQGKNWPLGAALATLLILVIALSLVLIRWLNRRTDPQGPGRAAA